MDSPLTPPRQTQSSIQQLHRHQQEAKAYASPPKTPRWRSDPQAHRNPQYARNYVSPSKTPRWRSEFSTPMANTSRKRGRGSWTPPTPTSLPKCKWGHIAADPYEERAAGDGDVFLDKNAPENCLSVEASEAPVVGCSLAEEKPLYLAHVLFWDEDIIGVHCPFCLLTEYHLMRPPVNAAGPFSNPIWQKDMRVADCQPEMSFRLLFPFDRLAMKSFWWQWVPENSRWQTTGLEHIFAGEIKESSPVKEFSLAQGVAGGTTAGNFTRSGDQDCSDSVQVLGDIMKDHISILSDETLMTDDDLDLPIAFSNNDGDEAVTHKLSPKANTWGLQIAASLSNNPLPEYLTLAYGSQVAVMYRPVAVIPVILRRHKTVGFLAPTASSTRRVFTSSGWTSEVISDADMELLQKTWAADKEAAWQDLSMINNREYTDKVRTLSAQLGLEPEYHMYDKENPLGQVCFSHVEKQLVVVALEEHQSSKHSSHSETIINRMIYLDRAPCTGCLDFAKAVERMTNLRFEFNIMARVMTRDQLRAKIRRMKKRGKEMETETDNSADDSADDEIPSDNHRPQRSSNSKTVRISRERLAAGGETEGVYGIMAIIDRQKLYGELEYLVRWKRTWLTGAQLETQLNGQYSDEFDIISERTGKNGERKYLVEWDDGWVSSRDLGNSKKLIEDYERKRALLE